MNLDLGSVRPTSATLNSLRRNVATVSKNDEFGIKHEEFCIKTRNCVLKMMDFAVELMLNATQRGAAKANPLPIMCRQLIGRWTSMTDSIAAFLIAYGNYSYYSASTGWFDSDWVRTDGVSQESILLF